MRFSKLGALCAATAIAATGLVLPFAQSASALAPHVACSKLAATTTISGQTGTTKSNWSSCTPATLSAGGTSTSTAPVNKLTSTLTSKITWKNGKGTTTVAMKYTTQKTKGTCPAGTLYRTIISGTTKTSTGAAAKIVKPNETISATICTKSVSGKFVSSLLPGTKFKL